MNTICAILLAVGSVSVAAAAGPTTKPTFGEYRLLTEQNMFVRDRQPPRVERPDRGQRDDPTTPEAIERYTVLRGVAIEDDELHAYVENTRLNQARKLAVGDLIGTGRVVEIGIDAVAFEAGGRVRWIEIGDNLQGLSVAPPPSAGATTLPSDTANLSMVERLKARRLQEQGK